MLTSRKRKKSGGVTITVGMIFTIANTDRGVLDWCQDVVGAGHVVQARSTKKNPRRLDIYRYNLDAQTDISRLLPILLPFLKIKKDRARLALRYLSSRQGSRRNAPFTAAQLDMLFDVRHANQKRYSAGGMEHILYKKVPYTRAQFKKLLFQSRNGGHYRSVEWSSKMDKLLGAAIDRVVAVKLGLKLAQVQRRRTQLGIPSVRRQKPRKP